MPHATASGYTARVWYMLYKALVPYPRERGPMGGVPYIAPRLGDGPIFEVSISPLCAIERLGKLPMLAS